MPEEEGQADPDTLSSRDRRGGGVNEMNNLEVEVPPTPMVPTWYWFKSVAHSVSTLSQYHIFTFTSSFSWLLLQYKLCNCIKDNDRKSVVSVQFKELYLRNCSNAWCYILVRITAIGNLFISIQVDDDSIYFDIIMQQPNCTIYRLKPAWFMCVM